MPIAIEGFWYDFLSFIEEAEPYSIKKLNDRDYKEIYVVKLCKMDSINNFLKEKSGSIDTIFLGSEQKIFIAFIPKNSKLMINLFCCKKTMEDVYKRMSTFGLAIEGCFQIKPLVLEPEFFKGHMFEKGDEKTLGSLSSNFTNSSFLIIKNHNEMFIRELDEFAEFKNSIHNIQYIEGQRLYKNGEPLMNFDEMKDLEIDGRYVDGKNVRIDYEQLKIYVENHPYDFSSIGKNIRFIDVDYFVENKSPLIIGTDIDLNTFIFYHPKMDRFNMYLLLKTLKCKEAIMICNRPDAHIIWKERGQNYSGKSDFIGNPLDLVSNVITFTT